MRRKRNIVWAGLLVSMTAIGCGQDWKAPTHPVSGRVTINGEPAEGVIVHLYSVGEKVDARNSRPWGIVQEDGTFTLTTYESGDGAPAGKYKVTLKWPVNPHSPSFEDRLGHAYARPERSQWSVEIVEGKNVIPPINLQDVAVDSLRSRSQRKGPLMPGGPGPDKPAHR